MIKVLTFFNIRSFKKDLRKFKKGLSKKDKIKLGLEGIDVNDPAYQGKFSGAYTKSINFELMVDSFWKKIKKQIEQHFVNKKMDKNLIPHNVAQTLEKIQNSPAGFSLKKFGLGEFAKNVAEPGFKIRKLNIVITLDEEKDYLDSRGVTILIMDNGTGFPIDYLNRDKEKRQGLSNVRVIKDPDYIEGKSDLSELDRIKNKSKKRDISGSLGGKELGLILLAKTVSIHETKNPEKILGRMLVGNIEDFNKSIFKSLTSDIADFKLPKQGAVTVLYSPYYSEKLIESCSGYSMLYQDFIESIRITKKIMQHDLDELDNDSKPMLCITLSELNLGLPPDDLTSTTVTTPPSLPRGNNSFFTIPKAKNESNKIINKNLKIG